MSGDDCVDDEVPTNEQIEKMFYAFRDHDAHLRINDRGGYPGDCNTSISGDTLILATEDYNGTPIQRTWTFNQLRDKINEVLDAFDLHVIIKEIEAKEDEYMPYYSDELQEFFESTFRQV